MAEKSAISFVPTLVPFLVLRNWEMPLVSPSLTRVIVSGLLERLAQ
jgi:hypothetical protein